MIRPPSYTMSTTSTVATPAVPKTVNRLFVTSLVINAWMFGLGPGYVPIQRPQVFEILGMIGMGAVIINHFLLWHLAKKQKRTAASSNSSLSSKISLPQMSSADYPLCVISIPNIVFTCIVAVLFTLVGLTPFWNAIGIWSWHVGMGQRLVTIFLGLACLAEAGVLWALFGLYVQNRKVYLKSHPKPAAQAGSLSV